METCIETQPLEVTLTGIAHAVSEANARLESILRFLTGNAVYADAEGRPSCEGLVHKAEEALIDATRLNTQLINLECVLASPERGCDGAEFTPANIPTFAYASGVKKGKRSRARSRKTG